MEETYRRVGGSEYRRFRENTHHQRHRTLIDVQFPEMLNGSHNNIFERTTLELRGAPLRFSANADTLPRRHAVPPIRFSPLADTPTRRYGFLPNADTPTRRYADTFLPPSTCPGLAAPPLQSPSPPPGPAPRHQLRSSRLKRYALPPGGRP
jgi:hypothetical protein